jgi:hypothetical protein
MDTDRTKLSQTPQTSSEHQFSTVFPHHLKEWLKSCVDEKLTTLNLISLSGFTTYEYLLYGLPDSERRNDGRLRDKWLHRYAHLESGGWWVSGLDPLNNWQPMMWGRFKPDNPRLCGKKDKSIKYESPPKVANRVTYFNIPAHIWDRIAARYSVKRYHSPLALRLQDRINLLCFWEWLQKHPEIPIILTEGEKKAACLLSMGFVAIALPGIWGGRVGSKHNEQLHPDLLPLAQQGRKFIILFDYETKPKTRYNIYQATLRTGEAIEKAGCDCEVASLPGAEKGVDDFIAARGESAEALLTSIIDDALTLAEYQRVCYPRPRGLSSKYPADIELNTQFLSQEISIAGEGQEAEDDCFVRSKVKGKREKEENQSNIILQNYQSLKEEASNKQKLTFWGNAHQDKKETKDLYPFPFPLAITKIYRTY